MILILLTAVTAFSQVVTADNPATIYYLHVGETIKDEPTVTLLTVTYNTKGKVCQLIKKPQEIVSAINDAEEHRVLRVDKATFSAITRTCGPQISPGFSLFQQSGGLIYPGTKWCGPGDVANNFDDLGPERETDMCCRSHDFCDTINSGESKFGLSNTSPFPRLHCKCDSDFMACLKKTKSLTAKTIGEVYFNVVKNQCYDFEYPVISCKKAIIPGTCEDYEFDERKTKIYQWFIPKHFKFQ